MAGARVDTVAGSAHDIGQWLSESAISQSAPIFAARRCHVDARRMLLCADPRPHRLFGKGNVAFQHETALGILLGGRHAPWLVRTHDHTCSLSIAGRSSFSAGQPGSSSMTWQCCAAPILVIVRVCELLLDPAFSSIDDEDPIDLFQLGHHEGACTFCYASRAWARLTSLCCRVESYARLPYQINHVKSHLMSRFQSVAREMSLVVTKQNKQTNKKVPVAGTQLWGSFGSIVTL